MIKSENGSQLRNFFLGGVFAVFLDWGSFIAFIEYVGLNATVAKALSFFLGTVFAFYFNGLITFKSQLDLVRFICHITLYGFSLFVNVLVFRAFSNNYSSKLLSHSVTALISATLVSMCINFLGMRYWVFRARKIIID